MDKVLSAIKCVNCKCVMQSPIALPCGHTVCEKHESESPEVLCCGECLMEHKLTHKCARIEALARIIDAEIHSLDFGRAHDQAQRSCAEFADLLRGVDELLNDPAYYTHARIGELKNAVHLKGDEVKIRIDDHVARLLAKLDRYERACAVFASSALERSLEAKTLTKSLKTSKTDLNNWLNALNRLKFDETQWNDIKYQCDEKLSSMKVQLDVFKNELLLNKFGKINEEVDLFKKIESDSIFGFSLLQLDSKIIEKYHLAHLTDLLEFPLNSKLTLLYRASVDGFKACQFHLKCNNKPNTLIIVKTTTGCIFGGYTEAQWSDTYGRFKSDKNAFIFSLVNAEDSGKQAPVRINVSNEKKAIFCSYLCGPTFGVSDFCIGDKSNQTTTSYSKLGNSYVHTGYLNETDKAYSFLAGASRFRVYEIEVFIKQ